MQLAPVSVEEQREAAEAIRRELGVVEEDGSLQVRCRRFMFKEFHKVLPRDTNAILNPNMGTEVACLARQ
jgi:hypothetical protein